MLIFHNCEILDFIMLDVNGLNWHIASLSVLSGPSISIVVMAFSIYVFNLNLCGFESSL